MSASRSNRVLEVSDDQLCDIVGGALATNTVHHSCDVTTIRLT